MKQNKIAYITWGRGPQIVTYYDFAKYIDTIIYVHNLPSVDISRYKVLIIPDPVETFSLTNGMKKQINTFIAEGGFLVAFSLNGKEDWLEAIDVKYIHHPCKDWLWWAKPNPYIPLKQVNPDTSLNKAIPFDNMTWHWEGVYQTDDKTAVSYLNTDDDKGSLILDFQKLPNGGRVLLSTLDPHHHNGERFMPAATAFLKDFYRWLNTEIDRSLDIPEFRVTYIKSAVGGEQELKYPAMALKGIPSVIELLSVEDIAPETLSATDIIYIPDITDQCMLRKKQEHLMNFLYNGGHIIACTEIAIPWLPILKPFQAVKPQPFTNLKTRVRNDPFGFFSNMPDGFDAMKGREGQFADMPKVAEWKGILGLYARGWSEMPEGALWLTDIGSEDDPKPADWLWQPPFDLEDTKAPMPGKLFMHSGHGIIRFPEFGKHKENLFRDVCLGLIKYRNVPINPFTRFEYGKKE